MPLDSLDSPLWNSRSRDGGWARSKAPNADAWLAAPSCLRLATSTSNRLCRVPGAWPRHDGSWPPSHDLTSSGWDGPPPCDRTRLGDAPILDFHAIGLLGGSSWHGRHEAHGVLRSTEAAESSAWGDDPHQSLSSPSNSEFPSLASGGHLSVRLSLLGLDAHAEMLERCAAEHLEVPEAAMAAWGGALELTLARQLQQEQQQEQQLGQHQGQQQGQQQGPTLSVAHSIARLLVAFSRVRRRPPHRTMNALLAAMQPHLMDMSERRLAACLGALSRLR